MNVVVVVPGLRIQSEMNTRSHWTARRKRFNCQACLTQVALSQVSTADRLALRDADRVNLRLVRVGGRRLDRDNLAGGCKAVLDAVCIWLDIDDGDEKRLGIEWSQEPGGKDYSVRIELATA